MSSELARNPPDGVSVGLGEDDNIFQWELMIVGPPDTLYEGGFFSAKLQFPTDFPNSPPEMIFSTPIWHPNGAVSTSPFIAIITLLINIRSFTVYENGKVCISILHPPGEDAFNEHV